MYKEHDQSPNHPTHTHTHMHNTIKTIRPTIRPIQTEKGSGHDIKRENPLSCLPTQSSCSHVNHTIIRAAFVCLFVCSPTPPRSFDGSSPNLVGVCRWTSELPLRGSFFKRSTGQRVKRHFFEADDTRLRPHRCKRHTASKSLILSTGIFTSMGKSE